MAPTEGTLDPGRQVSTGDVVIYDGALYKDGVPISYQTVQPAPNQWVAMCVVPILAFADAQATHRMIVGTGTSEPAAVEALRARVASLSTPIAAESPSTPVIPMDGPATTGIA